MQRAIFRAHRDGQLVTFESTGKDNHEAFQRGVEWGNREFGRVELVLYEHVHEVPTISNVKTFEWVPGHGHRLVRWNGYHVSETPFPAAQGAAMK